MAVELGYDQLTGILYAKPQDQWYEVFSLQASTWGNPFFYLNYGVIVPEKIPTERESLIGVGWRKMRRLRFGDRGAFPCATKAEIEESARYALEEYKKVACPWFEQLTMDEVEDGLF
jgi:hypothetical protein